MFPPSLLLTVYPTPAAGKRVVCDQKEEEKVLLERNLQNALTQLLKKPNRRLTTQQALQEKVKVTAYLAAISLFVSSSLSWNVRFLVPSRMCHRSA